MKKEEEEEEEEEEEVEEECVWGVEVWFYSLLSALDRS